MLKGGDGRVLRLRQKKEEQTGGRVQDSESLAWTCRTSFARSLSKGFSNLMIARELT